MRSAVSAGATGLVTRRHRAATLTPAALKAAAGAAEYLPVATVPGIPGGPGDAGRSRSVVGGARRRRRSVALGPAGRRPAHRPGARREGRGLGRLVRQRCDLAVPSPCRDRSSRSTWPRPPPWPASRWPGAAGEGARVPAAATFRPIPSVRPAPPVRPAPTVSARSVGEAWWAGGQRMARRGRRQGFDQQGPATGSPTIAGCDHRPRRGRRPPRKSGSTGSCGPPARPASS